MQGLSIANLSFFCVLFSLILTINLTYNVQAAKFIRNGNSCLDFITPSPPSCTPITLNPCPNNRFSNYSDSLKWDLIPVSSTNEIIIKSNKDQLCLSTASSVVEVCPCDYGISQLWTLNDDKILSSADAEKCLGIIGEEVNIGNCKGSTSWETYHVASNTVNLYPKPDFADKAIQLFVNTTYDSKTLPIEIFSSPYSVEIPPGFEFIIERKNNIVETFDNDNTQMTPIDSISSIIFIKLKPGIIIYEHPAYFGASKFIKVNNEIPSNSFPIGSVLVSKDFRGVIWSNSNFTGVNLGLFEHIIDFTGVSVATNQDFAASLNVDSNTCENECGSGGVCSDDGICVCKPGFTGDRCEKCLSGFFGQNCQECNCTGYNKTVCDDGMAGTGECKCNKGFIGENCDACAPGFFGKAICSECKCVNGLCDEQGVCECIAGFLLDKNNQCIECDKGYYKSGTNCKSCPPGCDLCDETGKCLECFSTDLEVSPDNLGECILKPTKTIPPTSCLPNEFVNIANQCEVCSRCETCVTQSTTEGTTGKCFLCNSQSFYFKGSCVQAISGKCMTDTKVLFNHQNPVQAFFSTTKGTCEACPSSCLDCRLNVENVENASCTKCMPGFFLDNGECVKNCEEGKYVDTDFKCQACSTSCASCKGPGENECIKCLNNNYFSLNGSCSSTQCPSGFVAIDTVCTKCHTDCLECSGPGINQCTKCQSNRPILKDGQCIEVCPMGTYADKNGTCQQCNAECSSCVGPRADQCLGCNNQNKVIIGGSCSGSCPTGSVLNLNEKLCQSLNGGEIIPPVEAKANKPGLFSKFNLKWWHFLLIGIGLSILFIIIIFSLIRCYNVRRRKKRTQELGDQIDDNTVSRNLKNMYKAHKMPTQPEMSHTRNVSAQEVEAPPAYNHRDGNLYWQREEQKRRKCQKHVIVPIDSDQRSSRNSNLVTEESSSSSSNVGSSEGPSEGPSGSGNY